MRKSKLTLSAGLGSVPLLVSRAVALSPNLPVRLRRGARWGRCFILPILPAESLLVLTMYYDPKEDRRWKSQSQGCPNAFEDSATNRMFAALMRLKLSPFERYQRRELWGGLLHVEA